MKALKEHDDLRYTILEKSDIEEVVQLVASVFTDGSEPLTRELGVGPAEFDPFIRSLYPKFYREGLSVVASDARTTELVGVQLNDDMGTEQPALDGRYEWAAPVMALLGALDHRYFGEKAVKPNQYAHLFFVAVSPHYRGKRIAPQLLELSLELASRLGYKKALAEATGLISQEILRKAGFLPRVRIRYGDFEHKGNRPFHGIQDLSSVLLMDRDVTLAQKASPKTEPFSPDDRDSPENGAQAEGVCEERSTYDVQGGLQ
jgi:ribosomal protein S18 acetylase RimI-like enzyme